MILWPVSCASCAGPGQKSQDISLNKGILLALKFCIWNSQIGPAWLCLEGFILGRKNPLGKKGFLTSHPNQVHPGCPAAAGGKQTQFMEALQEFGSKHTPAAGTARPINRIFATAPHSCVLAGAAAQTKFPLCIFKWIIRGKGGIPCRVSAAAKLQRVRKRRSFLDPCTFMFS